MEPLVRTACGQPFTTPGAAIVEVIAGILLTGGFALLRARGRPDAGTMI